MDDIILEGIVVACVTEDCPNSGVLISVQINRDSPAVLCGPCGNWIFTPGIELGNGGPENV